LQSAPPAPVEWPRGINPATLQLNTLPEPDLEAEGFVDIFNGLDLEGWSIKGGRMRFEARNGEIVGTTVPGEPNGFLSTTRDYEDFIFTTEFRWAVPGNSGVMFRADTRVQGNGTLRVFGYQSEMDANPRRWTGGIYGEAMDGWKYPLTREIEHAAARAAVVQHSAWNRMTIEARGNIIRTWINGVPVAFLENNERTSGFFGLQVHSGKAGTIHWRNIRVKEFEPSLWTDLLDGGTLEHWQQLSGRPVGKGWSLKDGVLHRYGKKPGDLVTKNEYENFELVFDWKISEGGNSGVKYRTRGRLGLEYQVLDDDRHKDGKIVTHRSADLYDLVAAPEDKPLHQVGSWNAGRIVAQGGRIEHWLNGLRVVTTDLGSPEWKAAFEESKFHEQDGFGTGSGPILLQDHGDPVWYRNVRVRKLPVVP
jgi:hypothetical protein